MCLAIPGRVIRTFRRDGLPMAAVSFGGAERDVCLAYVPEAGVGDHVVVHVGFALSVVDEAEARRTLALLDELGELQEAEG